MALLDVLGRRWTLRILWELHQEAPLGFAELQARCAEISPSVLSQRLKELVAAGLLVPADAGGYAPGPGGDELARLLHGLDDWAKRWARRAR